MKVYIFKLFIMSIITSINMNDVTAEYLGSTLEGNQLKVVLTHSAKSITGILRWQGERLTLEGEWQEDEGIGYASSADDVFIFEIEIADGKLFLTLYSVDNDGDPDYNTAQEFELKKINNNRPNQKVSKSTMKKSVKGVLSNQNNNVTKTKTVFSDTFSGTINDVVAELVLQQEGAQLNGTADVSGYRYILSGTVAGTTATGTLNDPQTGGNIPFTAKINDQLILTLHMSDPFTGQTKSVVCEFQRGVVLQETDTTARKDIKHDMRLQGVWAKQEIMSSGDASIATQVFLYLNPDGTFRYGDARTVGGGATWSGNSAGGEATFGKWRTQNNLLHVMLNGSNQWQLFARFYIENNKLLLTGIDGTREIWYRQR